MINPEVSYDLVVRAEACLYLALMFLALMLVYCAFAWAQRTLADADAVHIDNEYRWHRVRAELEDADYLHERTAEFFALDDADLG